MSKLEFSALTVKDIQGKYKNGRLLPSELIEKQLDYIDSIEDRIRSFISLNRDEVLEKASELDRKFKEGKTPLSPLAGIPAAVKDNMCTENLPTTCGSKMLKNFEPPYTAAVIEKLIENDALLMGKTNLDEFAMGSSTENSYFCTTSNPWDLDRVPGGSSGGSAAAVAAGQCVFALGSDTGGSIRQPASYCGMVGMKPTYGRVSRYGVIPFASSLDQIGPITKDITDCAIVMNSICGRDERDSTSVDEPVPDFTEALIDDVKGLKIALPAEFFPENLDGEIENAVREAVENLRELGAECEEVSLPSTEYALPAYYLIAPAEASSNLACFDGVEYGYRSEKEHEDLLQMYKENRKSGFGSEVKRRIMLGTYALSSGYYDAYYLKAQKVRRLIIDDFSRIFNDYDLIMGPTTPGTAFKKGFRSDPLEMYLSDIFTVPASMAGLPAVTIPVKPCGGLPVGLQIIGERFDEESILRAAYTFQKHTDYHMMTPDIESEVGSL